MTTNKMVNITLVKSLIGRNPKHVVTAKTLGLTKINKTVQHKLTAPIQGMINKINYLLKVETV
tara:strand:- start:23691 stop:23879 length:189 start_codon:yes stop_codon:yes gene_type:complete